MNGGDMQQSRRSRSELGLIVVTVVLMIASAVLAVGWWQAASVDPNKWSLVEFEATVEFPEGSRNACVTAVSDRIRHQHGGPVCGTVYLEHGLDLEPGGVAHVVWFTGTIEADEAYDAFVLSPPRD